MKFSEKIKTVSIIGVGLIGGSIGLALRQLKIKNEKFKIIGIGRHKDKLKKAKKLKAIDEWTTDIEEGVKNADLIIIGTPVGTIVPIVRKILPFLKPGTTITDVGSVKAPIVSAIERLLSRLTFNGQRSTVFIGGHPLAGSEKSGIDHARADLFRGAICFLTPTKNTPPETTETIRIFWELLGARVLILSAQMHDCLLACSSHLPHLLAAGLVNLVRENKSKYSSQVLGPGFRDLTRIASSEPQIWTDISFSNREKIITVLVQFRNILLEVESVLKKKDRKKLKLYFQKAKNYRQKMFSKS